MFCYPNEEVELHVLKYKTKQNTKQLIKPPPFRPIVHTQQLQLNNSNKTMKYL